MILNLKKKLFRVQLFTQITKATEDLSSSIVLFAWSSSYLFQCTREVTLVDFSRPFAHKWLLNVYHLSYQLGG